MAYTLWWVGLVGVVLGVVLSFASAEIRDRLTRKRALRGHFEALSAEIRICGAIAKGYLSARVMSPAYRMPLIGHERSLPAVLAEANLTPTDSEALIRFYNNAKAFNLCLDYCNDALWDKSRDEQHDRLRREVDRARLKAKKLAPGATRPTQYEDALEVIARNQPGASVQPLEFEADEPDV